MQLQPVELVQVLEKQKNIQQNTVIDYDICLRLLILTLHVSVFRCVVS